MSTAHTASYGVSGTVLWANSDMSGKTPAQKWLDGAQKIITGHMQLRDTGSQTPDCLQQWEKEKVRSTRSAGMAHRSKNWALILQLKQLNQQKKRNGLYSVMSEDMIISYRRQHTAVRN
jgi:hypothetical protein